MNDNILTPRFNITDDMSGAIRGIDQNSWLIEEILLMPKHEAWIRREVSVQRAAGTTRIEGATMDEEQVSALVKKAPTGKLNEDERENINALAAYEFVDYLSDQPDIPIDELVIRQLDRYFLKGAPEVDTPGIYRKGQNTVGKFNPPDQGDVPALMRAFATWLQNEQEEISPILKAGIAHMHLVAIHPFWDGNGRTARALATLILQRSRFGFKKLLSLESFIFSIREHYFAAIERTLGARFMPDYDSTPWLEFFTSSLFAHTITLIQTLTDWRRSMDRLHKTLAKVNVSERQTDGLAYAIRTGRITRSDYIEITSTSPVTASRDLAYLAREGWLIPIGKTRSRIYLYAHKDSESEDESTAVQGRLFDETNAREAQPKEAR